MGWAARRMSIPCSAAGRAATDLVHPERAVLPEEEQRLHGAAHRPGGRGHRSPGGRLSLGCGGCGPPPAAIVLSRFGPARLQVAPGTRLRGRGGTAEGPVVFSAFWTNPKVPDVTVSVNRGAVVIGGGEGRPRGWCA